MQRTVWYNTMDTCQDSGVHEAQGHWLGPARVIGVERGNVWVSHRATAVKCAKEQLRMASPAEREMREMLMVYPDNRI